jgi:hypothetical protein
MKRKVFKNVFKFKSYMKKRWKNKSIVAGSCIVDVLNSY